MRIRGGARDTEQTLNKWGSLSWLHSKLLGHRVSKKRVLLTGIILETCSCWMEKSPNSRGKTEGAIALGLMFSPKSKCPARCYCNQYSKRKTSLPNKFGELLD